MIMTGPEFRVGKPLQSAAKSVVATITSLAGLATLFATAIGDGSVSTAEVGTLVTAAITGVATVIGVWAKRNKDL